MSSEGRARRALLAITAIRETLWPKGREDESWDPDTIDIVSRIVVNFGFAPIGNVRPKKRKRKK